MARTGSTGPSDPGPVAPGPRDFPLVRNEDLATSDVEGDSQAEDEAKAYRRFWSLGFGILMVLPYGGAPGGIIVIPERMPPSYPDLEEEDVLPDDGSVDRAFKWTLIYEMLQETDTHPHLVPFRGRDPWTGFAVLERPKGPTLAELLERNATHLYAGSARRLQAKYLPLAYQWALELLSVLTFLHKHGVYIGDVYDTSCWISEPSLSLALMGFSSASVRWHPREGGHIRWVGDLPRSGVSPHVHGIWNRNPMPATDLFVWVCVVFQIMTGFWPGTTSAGESDSSVYERRSVMSNFSSLPRLSSEHLGGIVRRTWDGEFSDAEHLQEALITEIRRLGWETEGRYKDKVAGFSAESLVFDSP